MREEEIIKIIKYMLENKNTDINVIINYEAIQGLLDLYTKQQKEIERLNFENHMLKKWNKQLDENCISKDKIREKIKAFQDVKKEIIKNENKLSRASITYDIVRNDYCEKMLLELLEEE